MHNRTRGFCICLVGTALVGLARQEGYGASRLSAEASKQVADQFVARLERIETIDVRFSLRVEYFHEDAGLDPAKRVNYTLSDGRYVYDVLNDRHYLECRDSRKAKGSVTKAAMKQGIVRQLSTEIRRTIAGDEKEKEFEIEEGVIHDKPPAIFAVNGPDYFLRLSHFQWMRDGSLEGRYAVERVADESGDVRLIVRLRGRPLGDLGKGFYEIYTLSAAKGFSPYRLQLFSDGRPRAEAEFNLEEVDAGLWITTSGVATVYTKFTDEPIAFMQRTFEAAPDGVVINGQIRFGQFDLPFPSGTNVTDAINKSFYVEGVKSGQGQRRQVKTFAKHADIMAPKKPEQDNASSPASGTVVADYRTSWYQSVALWIVVGSVILIVVGFALIRRAG